MIGTRIIDTHFTSQPNRSSQLGGVFRSINHQRTWKCRGPKLSLILYLCSLLYTYRTKRLYFVVVFAVPLEMGELQLSSLWYRWNFCVIPLHTLLEGVSECVFRVCVIRILVYRNTSILKLELWCLFFIMICYVSFFMNKNDQYNMFFIIELYLYIIALFLQNMIIFKI